MSERVSEHNIAKAQFFFSKVKHVDATGIGGRKTLLLRLRVAASAEQGRGRPQKPRVGYFEESADSIVIVETSRANERR